ncbi:MAG: Lrp/AsnC family transcriptional regulator [Holosporales bacterium]|nr:Lrp/AsnC family transcriptional regulator [Holosporales bacterium]
MNYKLDSIDLLILSNLQKSGRMTNVELAKRAKISAPPCLRRLKSLEERKVISGYHADVDARVLGYAFSALCLVSLAKHSTKHVENFIRYIHLLDRVRECFATTGEYDYVLRIVAKDFPDYENFISNKLKGLDNIVQVKSYVNMKQCKNENGVPIETELENEDPKA